MAEERRTERLNDHLAATFEGERGRLHAIAYRMLGSHADADDAVQETWLRLSHQDVDAIGNLAGWLTTVVGRISLDELRSRRSRKEASYGGPVPEVVAWPDDARGPEDDAALGDTLGLALITVLDSLRPGERLAFVLHDLFGVPFDEIGRILGRSADAAKMQASRARSKVRGVEPPVADRVRQRAVVDAFMSAARDGDFAALLRVLDPEVRLTDFTSHGIVMGSTTVASRARAHAVVADLARAVLVDDRPAVLSWRGDGTVQAILVFTIAGDRITAIEVERDPGRLALIDLPGPGGPDDPATLSR